MGTKSIDIVVSQKLEPYLYTIKDGTTLNDKATLSVILGLFVAKTITLEKAAELAGKSIWDFIDVLKDYQIPWGEYGKEDLEMDEAALDKLAGGIYG